MAKMEHKLGWVQRILSSGKIEVGQMKFCEVCRMWYFDDNHMNRHLEPVEPNILVKET